MTAAELRARIEREIGANWTRTNAHGCDLRRCLITPVKRSFEAEYDASATVDLWIVLEEHPESCDGYKIVYDEKTERFGLACPGIHGREVHLGAYGDTFMQAFDAM